MDSCLGNRAINAGAFQIDEVSRLISDQENTEEMNHSLYKFWKDIFDRFLAFCFLIISLPAMAAIALSIKLDSKGKVIFRREQVGLNGRRFIAYKFRTMIANNDDKQYREYIAKYVQENMPYTTDEDGQPVYKLMNDARITGFGAFLRKTNLDELPQFFNILKGDMSLVGPRPDIPYAVQMYQDWHRQRLLVKPGLTGLWQTSRRKSLSFEEMVRLDIDYIHKQSLLLDSKILLKTVGVVLNRDGSC